MPDHLKLFRREAIENKRDSWLSDIVLSSPPSGWFIATTYVALTAILLLFVCLGNYTRKALVSGFVVPDKGIIKVQPREQGTVERILVNEGEAVKKGQLLVQVSTERTTQQGSTQKQIELELNKKRSSLEDERTKIMMLYAELSDANSKKIIQTNSEIQKIDALIRAQASRVEILQKIFEKNQQLFEKNFVSDTALQMKMAELLSEKAKCTELERSRTISQRELMSLQSEARTLPLKLKGETSAIDRTLTEVKQANLDNAARGELLLLAPAAGTVTAIQVEDGGIASPAQPIMSIIPDGSAIDVDLYVSSKSIGFVKIGTPAQLQFQAYPYQKFGSYPGKVVKISKTAVNAAELPFPVAPGESYYIVTIKPDSAYVIAYGVKTPLQVGMQVDADLWLDKRTISEWILEPLFSVTGRL